MLESLHIKNLALVSELDLTPSPNFNTVTGETGAGKSLIIGALKLLAGWRASAEIIRKGEKNCEATGIFRIDSKDLTTEINDMLEEAGVPLSDDGTIMIKRTISENGSRAFINGSAVPVNWLKLLGDKIIEIHGPHDNQTLLSTNVQLNLLDRFAGNQDLLVKCTEDWHQINQTQKDLAELSKSLVNPEEAELLRHQLKEIRNAGLTAEEEQELLARYKTASHSQHLLELTNALTAGLDQSDNSITAQLGEFVRMTREIEEIDPESGRPMTELLDLAFENLRDVASMAEEYGHKMDLDPEQLQEMENRLDLIQKIKRKYGHTVQDVLNTADRIAKMLENADGFDAKREQLEQLLQQQNQKHQAICKELHQKRTAASLKLSEAIEEKLRNLGFNQARFSIEIAADTPGENGSDAIEFLFAPNVGEDPHPLRKIASSGEIARVMLAIRTVLSEVDRVPILVFDEIDANIGGRVAGTVAEELHAVGQHHQVFSITHLPLIAAAGDCHYLVGKRVENERTFAEITPLEPEARINELMRMLGADENSDSARQHALELLKRSAEPGEKKSTRKRQSKADASTLPGLLLLILLFGLSCFTACNENTANSKLSKAIDALKSGNQNDAAYYAGQCLRYDDNNSHARVIRAICNMTSSDSNTRKKAIDDLEHALREYPGRRDFVTAYATALYLNHSYAIAIPQLQNAIRLAGDKNHQPELNNLKIMLANCFLKTNQSQKAMTTLTPLLRDPDCQNSPVLYNFLGITCLMSKKNNLALNYLAMGLRYTPQDTNLLQNMAVVYDLYLNKPDQAKALYRRCLIQLIRENQQLNQNKITKISNRMRALAAPKK